MRLIAAAVLLAAAPCLATELTAVRLYPAPEYTRLVIEGDENIPHRLSRLDNPPRLVLDLEVPGSDALIRPLIGRVLDKIPYIHRVRAARNNPQRIRIVFEVEGKISHSLFAVKPVANYGNRLVLDIAAPASGLLLRDLGFRRYAQQQSPSDQQDYAAERFVVVIDPGHGGEDPGATAVGGLYEKDIVLDISRRVYDKLDSVLGIDPILSRDSDLFLPLPTRVRRAHDVAADLFISIHADSAPNRKAMGAAVFTLSESGSSSKFARELARQANLSDVIGGVNLNLHEHGRILEETIRGLGREGKERSSRLLAADIIEHLSSVSGRHGTGLHAAGFAVLKSPQVPSVLVEVGFLSNPQEAQKLADSSYRDMIATALAEAVQIFFLRQQS